MTRHHVDSVVRPTAEAVLMAELGAALAERDALAAENARLRQQVADLTREVVQSESEEK